MLDLRRADAERQRAQRAMRRGMAVAADDRRARQRQAEFRPDDVHDALPHIQDRDVRHAELDDVLLQRLHLDAAVFFLDVGRRARADGRDVVVRHRDGQSGRRSLRPARRKPLERLRAGDLMQQMPVDVEDAGAVREASPRRGCPRSCRTGCVAQAVGFLLADMGSPVGCFAMEAADLDELRRDCNRGGGQAVAIQPCKRTVGRRDAGAEAGLQQVAAGRRLPVQHFAGGEHTGAVAQHQVVSPAHPTAGRRREEIARSIGSGAISRTGRALISAGQVAGRRRPRASASCTRPMASGGSPACLRSTFASDWLRRGPPSRCASASWPRSGRRSIRDRRRRHQLRWRRADGGQRVDRAAFQAGRR